MTANRIRRRMIDKKGRPRLQERGRPHGMVRIACCYVPFPPVDLAVYSPAAPSETEADAVSLLAKVTSARRVLLAATSSAVTV